MSTSVQCVSVWVFVGVILPQRGPTGWLSVRRLLRACARTSVGVCEKYEFVGKCQEVGSLMAELTDDPYGYKVIGLENLIHSNATVIAEEWECVCVCVCVWVSEIEQYCSCSLTASRMDSLVACLFGPSKTTLCLA